MTNLKKYTSIVFVDIFGHGRANSITVRQWIDNKIITNFLLDDSEQNIK